MTLTDRYNRLPVNDIKVLREDRQRRVVSVEGLIDSIQRLGVLNPIIVDADGTLIAGERRLEASRKLGLETIPCRFVEDLSPIELQIVELEENLRREDLTWQDNAKAIARLHSLYAETDPNWTRGQTATALSLSNTSITFALRVVPELENPKIAQAPTLNAAYNILSRVDSRKIADAMSDIIESSSELFNPQPVVTPAEPEQTEEAPGTAEDAPRARVTVPPPPPPQPEPVLNESFLDWAPKYTGRTYNFIHCDFPYGVNVFGGTQAGGNKWETYNDQKDVYWTLIECLCANLDRVMSHSGHIMFWLAGDIEIQHNTIATFRRLAPSLDFQTYPLIWQKSDNVGLLPDPKRGPRRIYETALIGSREDRLIVKAVANAYHAPTDKTYHPSTKPEPVLRHFFQMFVDENTRMLDPTCGGGSSLRAAESLGAKEVLGLEISPEYCANARTALRQFRALRKATKGNA